MSAFVVNIRIYSAMSACMRASLSIFVLGTPAGFVAVAVLECPPESVTPNSVPPLVMTLEYLTLSRSLVWGVSAALPSRLRRLVVTWPAASEPQSVSDGGVRLVCAGVAPPCCPTFGKFQERS